MQQHQAHTRLPGIETFDFDEGGQKLQHSHGTIASHLISRGDANASAHRNEVTPIEATIAPRRAVPMVALRKESYPDTPFGGLLKLSIPSSSSSESISTSGSPISTQGTPTFVDQSAMYSTTPMVSPSEPRWALPQVSQSSTSDGDDVISPRLLERQATKSSARKSKGPKSNPVKNGKETVRRGTSTTLHNLMNATLQEDNVDVGAPLSKANINSSGITQSKIPTMGTFLACYLERRRRIQKVQASCRRRETSMAQLIKLRTELSMDPKYVSPPKQEDWERVKVIVVSLVDTWEREEKRIWREVFREMQPPKGTVEALLATAGQQAQLGWRAHPVRSP